MPWSRFDSLERLLPGLVLSLVIGIAAIVASEVPQFRALGLSPLIAAIIIGALIGNTKYIYVQDQCSEGVNWTKSALLRIGIIFFGFQITFRDFATVGFPGIAIAACVLTTTFLGTVWFGRRFMRMRNEQALLIAAGASICGAAAVVATEEVAQTPPEDAVVAIATVVVFGTIAMLVYPLIFSIWGDRLHMSESAFGVYIGSTVHEVAQVIVAGTAVSELAARHAVITKMSRVVMLAPFLLALALYVPRRTHGAKRTRTPIPWFAIFFIGIAAINSLDIIQGEAHRAIVWVDTLVLAMAMGALGLTTQASLIRRAGLKPLILASLCFVWLVVGGAAINYAIATIRLPFAPWG